ncbi:NAD-dependent dihydropyrimidine dehydrogenase subunit PreA [Candidatus Contubernalis alkaliaceticus]|uniref:NAD-dependent dihydropyrimidine dehydrogenase subunit PreA n=1 Tax=Candidatus Contubernalis alkaliaceticus TaxID=338645 RepID=UPI001F4C3A97|nr:NAD-dependent dihydropyrimidine dehydrogenase subunit PreA [Candidatus Contubernalis alkalaceticus]UNC92226.1 NAD-dependent dihydropyrimidine dehydrogenase subunit PreA [Candidatus Contubernalis alkalaceticus]
MDLFVKMSGLHFPNPFILSSAPPTARGDMIKEAFRLGWGGVVTKTIKPDKMALENVSPRFTPLRNSKKSIIGFQNIELLTTRSLKSWLQDIKEIKDEYPENILIASIMAEVKKEDWQELSLAVQDAGADALELNFSCPHGMPEQGVGQAIGQDHQITGEITRWVKKVADVPVIVKLTPNVTDITIVGKAAKDNGADALSAINTVQVLANIDLNTFEPQPSVEGKSTFGGYSGLAVKPIGLRCVAQLASSVELPILGIGGIGNWQHAAEYMLAGASTVQICTAVMLEGYEIISEMKAGLSRYLTDKNLKTVQELTGLALPKLTSHENLSRQYRVTAEINEDSCVAGCNKCVVACSDGGRQAIELNEHKKAVVNESKCDGCSLCSHVCNNNSISMRVN